MDIFYLKTNNKYLIITRPLGVGPLLLVKETWLYRKLKTDLWQWACNGCSIFCWNRSKADSSCFNFKLFTLNTRDITSVHQFWRLAIPNMFTIRNKEITVTLTRPFLRLSLTLNFPWVKFFSDKEFSEEWWPDSTLATIEDMYSRAAAALSSWRSECNNPNILEIWSAIIQQQWFKRR